MARTPQAKRPRRNQHAPRARYRGWDTSDQDEIERRRLRATQEAIPVRPLDGGLFGAYLVGVSPGRQYRVEIRSLTEHINSCACPDYRVNGLGTCKHIEAVLAQLQRGPKRAYKAAAETGSPYVEIFLERRERPPRVRVLWPAGLPGRSALRTRLTPLFSTDGTLLAEPLSALPALRREIEGLRRDARARVRQSEHLEAWWGRLKESDTHRKAREAFMADVAAGRRSLDLVKLPLYPYQREGMLHLAFTGRALLADEMGLGKTVQAIAACELLRRLKGIQRVLVVCPASLKTEWEEQIAKFTGLPALVVQGPRAARLRQYRERAFFYLSNYEQIRPDGHDINDILAPDVVILDEAQRIKNWQTQTAEAVKRLASPHAFVLTGTPLENRIDEVYSIVQFLNPQLFGPLFRFNRDFYVLDEKGRPQGYKNLDELHRRLRPVMLRRRKAEVEGDLPGRTINNYFVEMVPEQTTRYEEYYGYVSRLAAQARRRPLTKEEFEKLQRWLACMRMLCDTPYILDSECRDSPKLEELGRVLEDLLGDGEHKVIIFSEWERMLELVRGLAGEMGLEHAWHTGSVPQQKRRQQINRFKQDPDCRLFLSTDSGSVGLNLQAADVVINMDLPWNPARLEQRIARAWRKHQTRAVQVINLVAEDTIEHQMLHRLEQKRTLAEGVLDGRGDLTRMDIPSGRARFVERVQSLMGQPAAAAGTESAPSADPLERVQQDVLARLSDRLDVLEVYGADTPIPTVVAVLDHADEAASSQLETALARHLGDQDAKLEVMDRNTYEAMSRLMKVGVLSIAPGARVLHRSALAQDDAQALRSARLAKARSRFQEAARMQRMARVLAEGGFPQEAMAPVREALETGIAALGCLHGRDGEVSTLESLRGQLSGDGALPGDTAELWEVLQSPAEGMEDSDALALQGRVATVLESIDRALTQ
jgi:superfamily II DNA or RNA helicase